MSVNPMDVSAAYGQALRNTAKSGAAASQGGGGADFSALLKSVVDETVKAGQGSEAATLQATAKQAELVDVVTAVANAELTLETVVAVRDQVIQAYQDVLRMPI